MPKFSKEDLDKITTYTGITAAVCLGIASTIASTLAAVPGDKILGMNKTPFTAAGAFLGGVGAIALGVQGVFTNKVATMHPTTSDMEKRATIQEQADFYRYSPNFVPPTSVEAANNKYQNTHEMIPEGHILSNTELANDYPQSEPAQSDDEWLSPTEAARQYR